MLYSTNYNINDNNIILNKNKNYIYNFILKIILQKILF